MLHAGDFVGRVLAQVRDADELGVVAREDEARLPNLLGGQGSVAAARIHHQVEVGVRLRQLRRLLLRAVEQQDAQVAHRFDLWAQRVQLLCGGRDAEMWVALAYRVGILLGD
jgi:hypothetical protein